MSDYGLRVRDASGNIILDITDRITRHVYTSSQTSSSGNSGALSQLTDKLSGQFCVPINVGLDIHKTNHAVSRSVDTISWTSYSYAGILSPATCVIFSFIYT